jgi:metal-sulfur cluster biosynthetic enzyme
MTDEELKEQVVLALKAVYDPEIPVDVYELGLIYDIKIFPVNNVYILMTLCRRRRNAEGTMLVEFDVAAAKAALAASPVKPQCICRW